MGGVKNNVFVFVVCGSAEHIQTLNFSLPFLQKKSEARIIVVTDLDRNEEPIAHNDIIHVETPKSFTNHQASIYLKTGLHKFLPPQNLYCYLDSDILAIGANPDLIFNEFISPIRFAADHTAIQFFSPFALKCGCMEEFASKAPLRLEHENWFHDTLNEIEQEVEKNKRHFLYSLDRLIYSLPLRYYRLNRKYRLEKKTGRWLLNDGTYIVLENFPEVKPLECGHLTAALVSEFNLPLIPDGWQHWNGGVFLFGDESTAFMDDWHHNSLSLFNKQGWNTRDQATLIATVWQHGIQDQPLLDSRWNLIADYNSNRTLVSEDGRLIHDDKSIDDVELIHVYHHFGDKDWPVWNAILSILDGNVNKGEDVYS